MPRIKNTSPLGDLDVPLLRRVVAADEEIDVTDDQASRLLGGERFALVEAPKTAKKGE